MHNGVRPVKVYKGDKTFYVLEVPKAKRAALDAARDA